MCCFSSRVSAYVLALLACRATAAVPEMGAEPGNVEPLYECHSDVSLGPVVSAAQKGFAVDDTTFRWCSDSIPGQWPNAGEKVTSIRLFKAWDATWQDDRELAWQNLKNFVTTNGANVLVGTSISCLEDEDAREWEWTKDLLKMLGPNHVMGLAIGNELELLFTKTAFSEHITADCINDVWDSGRFWRRFTEIVQEFDDLGFGTVPVTSVFGGLALAGDSEHPFFEQPGKALVNSFFKNATERYGDRYAWTWNTYPYFDPKEKLDEGTTDSCEFARGRSLCFDVSCDAPKSMAYYRKKMAMLTGKAKDILWIGETGWSSDGRPNSDMKFCKNWAAKESLKEYYNNFIKWDLSVPGEEPPDHVFYFSIRDALNFGNDEHFGIIEQCFMPQCKLHSDDYEPPEAETPSSPGCYYQQPTVGNGNCDGPWKFWKLDEYGMAHANASHSQEHCLDRKHGHDGYCGTDTKWFFVAATSTTVTWTGATTTDAEATTMEDATTTEKGAPSTTGATTTEEETLTSDEATTTQDGAPSTTGATTTEEETVTSDEATTTQDGATTTDESTTEEGAATTTGKATTQQATTTEAAETTTEVSFVMIECSLQMDVNKFDKETYLQTVAKLSGVLASDVAIERLEFQVKVGYSFQGVVTEVQAVAAIASAAGISQNTVVVVLSKSRRLATGHRRMAATDVEATIKTDDAEALIAIEASIGDSEKLQTAMESQGVTSPATITMAPQESVLVTTSLATEPADSVTAPESEALSSELGEMFGTPITATVVTVATTTTATAAVTTGTATSLRDETTSSAVHLQSMRIIQLLIASLCIFLV